MKSLIEKQINPAYWLVTASVYQEAVHQLHSIDDATPLFEGKAYEDVMPLSPWLIPISSLTELDSETLNKGMVLTSDAGMNAVLAHLRSLLIAGLEGDEVLFRFYDPLVIMPMLAVMSEVDKHALLGHVTSWSNAEILENGEFVITTYSTLPKSDFVVNNEPWWVIKEEHLKEMQDIPKLAHHIERRLWEVLPQVMNQISAPKQTFISVLQSAQDAGLSPADAQLKVLANLVVNQIRPIGEISKALALSWDEEQRLQHLVEDIA